MLGPMRNSLLLPPFLLALALLSACGGGGGSTPDSAPQACLPELQDGVAMSAGGGEAAECNAGDPLTLAYAGGPQHLLDLYRPAGATGPLPTVVWIHGGAWRSGSREQVDQARRLVCRGYAVASIDYRLTPDAIFPAQIHDVKAAIRYLRANAATLGLDGERFAAFGSSAGGHLAALAGTSAGVPALEDLSLGNAGTSSAVQAAVAWYAPTDFSRMDAQILAQGCPAADAFHGEGDSAESVLVGCPVGNPGCAAAVARADPTTYVGAGTPPIYLLHGGADCTVPPAQSALLEQAMDAAGRCAVRRVVTGAGHGGRAWQAPAPQQGVAAFLDAVLN